MIAVYACFLSSLGKAEISKVSGVCGDRLANGYSGRTSNVAFSSSAAVHIFLNVAQHLVPGHRPAEVPRHQRRASPPPFLRQAYLPRRCVWNTEQWVWGSFKINVPLARVGGGCESGNRNFSGTFWKTCVKSTVLVGTFSFGGCVGGEGGRRPLKIENVPGT